MKNRTRGARAFNSFSSSSRFYTERVARHQSRLIRSFSHLGYQFSGISRGEIKNSSAETNYLRRNDSFPLTEENERYRLIKIQKLRDIFILLYLRSSSIASSPRAGKLQHPSSEAFRGMSFVFRRLRCDIALARVMSGHKFRPLAPLHSLLLYIFPNTTSRAQSRSKSSSSSASTN